MNKKAFLLINVITIIFYLHCGLLEPEKPGGSLAILLQEQSSPKNLPKTNSSTTHDAVQCIVKKGSQTASEYNLTKKPA